MALESLWKQSAWSTCYRELHAQAANPAECRTKRCVQVYKWPRTVCTGYAKAGCIAGTTLLLQAAAQTVHLRHDACRSASEDIDSHRQVTRPSTPGSAAAQDAAWISQTARSDTRSRPRCSCARGLLWARGQLPTSPSGVQPRGTRAVRVAGTLQETSKEPGGGTCRVSTAGTTCRRRRIADPPCWPCQASQPVRPAAPCDVICYRSSAAGFSLQWRRRREVERSRGFGTTNTWRLTAAAARRCSRRQSYMRERQSKDGARTSEAHCAAQTQR